MGKSPMFLRNTLKNTMNSKGSNEIIEMVRRKQMEKSDKK
jgi:hypothetical protein